MKRLRRRRSWGIAALAVLAVLVLLAFDPAHDEIDVAQERQSAATPPLAEAVAEQTFVARHDGLWSVEVTARRGEWPAELPADSRLRLTLARADDPAAAPVVIERPADEIQDGQRLRFDFAPQFDSGGAAYRLTLAVAGCAAGECPLGLAYTPVEAYADGALSLSGAATAGDLWFVARYAYPVSAILADAGAALWRLFPLLPGLVAVLALPGLALAIWLLPRRDGPAVLADPGALAGIVLALSVGFWPLLILWATTVGLRLTPAIVWWVCVALLAAAYAGWHRRGPLPRPAKPPAERGAGVVLAIILFLVLLTRLLEMRDLVAPAWVDAVHHTTIAQLMAAQGTLPAYQPPSFLVSQFYYHFGFHADAAALIWLGDVGAPQAVLILGQVLNVGSVLALYGLAVAWTGRRWAGVAAVAVAGLLAYMPAYYLSWSRYTQMAGLLVLAPLCLVTGELLRPGRHAPELRVLAGLLLAGLALVHYRVLAFYLTFWLCYPLCALWRTPRGDAWRQLWRVGVGVAVPALALAAPWIWRFAQAVLPWAVGVPGALAAPDSYGTDFPADLLQAYWTPHLLVAAGLGVAWAAVRRRAELLWMVPWVGLWFVLANLSLVGLPNSWFLNNSAVVISFWVPVGVLGGWLAAELGAGALALGRRLAGERGRRAALALVAAGAVALGLLAAWQLVDIVNRTTVLITADDLPAMEWVAENTPADARFLINTRDWQSGVRRGTDAGWWLPILTGRAVTLPCVNCYPEDGGQMQGAVNELAAAVEASAADDVPLADAALRRALRIAGVEYLYVGARGGPLMPEKLDGSPYVEALYVNGPVRVYRLLPE